MRVSATEYLQFISVPAPKVCLVRVNWTDGAGNVNRPTDRAMLDTLGLAGRMLPFPYFESTILGIETTSSAPFAMLAADPGGCNNAWSKLVADVNVTRIFTAIFQLSDIVFGMVPQAAIPAGSGKINSGCGRGAGGGFVGYDSTFAHEIGHLYGRPHVAVPGDSTNDPDYPNYGGGARSIGEVGIDTGTSPPTLFDPSGSDDIMSYGNNQWISPYTYQKIFDARDMHLSVPIDPRRLRLLLFLEFRVYRAARSRAVARFLRGGGVACRRRRDHRFPPWRNLFTPSAWANHRRFRSRGRIARGRTWWCGSSRTIRASTCRWWCSSVRMKA